MYLCNSTRLKVWLSPADIRLEPESIVQPDIFIAPRRLAPLVLNVAEVFSEALRP